MCKFSEHLEAEHAEFRNQNRFNKLGLWAVRDKLRFDKDEVYSWLTVRLLANRYEYIEGNDTCPPSSRDVYFIETMSISHNRADLDKQLSGLDSL